MKLKKLGNNETLIVYNNGIEILFSYETPVAGHIIGEGYFKTDTYYSVTTSKHINKYLKDFKDSAKVIRSGDIEDMATQKEKF